MAFKCYLERSYGRVVIWGPAREERGRVRVRGRVLVGRAVAVAVARVRARDARGGLRERLVAAAGRPRPQNKPPGSLKILSL